MYGQFITVEEQLKLVRSVCVDYIYVINETGSL